MTSDLKKPGAAFWTTVVVVVVVLAYPLSFGPACWITSRCDVGASAIPILYRPLTWALSPEYDSPMNRVCTWYAKVGAPDFWEWGPVMAVDQLPDGTTKMRHVGWMWGITGPTPLF